MESSPALRPLAEGAGSDMYLFSPDVTNLDERVVATFSRVFPTPSDLDQITFDMWKYDAVHFKHFFVAMLQRLDLIKEMNLDIPDLQRFLEVVHSAYRENAFHCFTHAFTVAQMVYCFIVLEHDTTSHLTKKEQFSLLVAALCHDIDHPGVSNGFLSRAESPLAVLYNDKSVLENHHAACSWRILTHSSVGLLRHFSEEERRDIRAKIVHLILSTDMALHFNFIREMQKAREVGFDWEDKHHRRTLLQLLIKGADISNEVRPYSVSRAWANRLTEEFASQSELEKKNGHPLSPWMVKGATPLHTTQLNFIDSCILPVFQELSRLLGAFDMYVDHLNKAKETWSARKVV